MMKHAVCVNVEKKNPTMSIAISNTQVNVGVYACMPVCVRSISDKTSVNLTGNRLKTLFSSEIPMLPL